jgi:hypothetical protein
MSADGAGRILGSPRAAEQLLGRVLDEVIE